MTKPRRLYKGDTIGIISPSSGVWRRSEMWRSVEAIERWGFKVKLGKYVYNNHFYLAGSDEARLEDLHDFFKDDSVDAIFCSQGGYGSSRLLRNIDYDIIRRNPKIFIGFSDITALHLAIIKNTGLVTFHGPAALSAGTDSMTPYRYRYLMRALLEEEPIGPITMSETTTTYLVKMRGGRVEAPIVGGNLTLICSTLGTPFEIDTEGKILFLEELDLEPWIIDHLLVHLINAGKFDNVKGIVVGECANCAPFKYDPGFPNQRSLEEVLFELLEPFKVPTIYGLPIGHTKDLATIPLGIEAALDVDKGVLEILERATLD